MSELTPIPKPALIVVTGRPGAGKTTLAAALGQAIPCPVISRDRIKEGFVNTNQQAGQAGDEIARHVYETFFQALGLLLSSGVTVIAEAAFQHKVWAPKLEELGQIARVRIIVCAANAQLAQARLEDRSRQDPAWRRFHGEASEVSPSYDPPHLDLPTLTVDTSNGYQPGLEHVIAFVRLQ